MKCPMFNRKRLIDLIALLGLPSECARYRLCILEAQLSHGKHQVRNPRLLKVVAKHLTPGQFFSEIKRTYLIFT